MKLLKAFYLLLFLASGIAFAEVDLTKIVLPSGFRIEILAKVPNAREMALGKNGTLFVGSMNEGKIYALEREKLKVKRVITLAEGVARPVGVAYKDGDLYFSAIDKIFRLPRVERALKESVKPILVSDKFPSDKHHGWKFIAFGPDGKLYVPIGAPCNVCDEGDKYANIMRMNKDGSGLELFAKGVRNTVGFDWHPETNVLWFTDNGRDLMGDNLPPCELNRAPKKGLHFGFPYCHGRDIEDPKFGRGKSCANYVPPVQELGPHVAPLGMTFYTGKMFPNEYRNQIFIAEHGSWNRSKKIGYRVTLVKLKDGKAVSYEPFAHGWLQGEEVSGRPADVLVDEDGALLVSDDYAGLIYRISKDQ